MLWKGGQIEWQSHLVACNNWDSTSQTHRAGECLEFQEGLRHNVVNWHDKLPDGFIACHCKYVWDVTQGKMVLEKVQCRCDCMHVLHVLHSYTHKWRPLLGQLSAHLVATIYVSTIISSY